MLTDVKDKGYAESVKVKRSDEEMEHISGRSKDRGWLCKRRNVEMDIRSK